MKKIPLNFPEGSYRSFLAKCKKNWKKTGKHVTTKDRCVLPFPGENNKVLLIPTNSPEELFQAIQETMLLTEMGIEEPTF